MTYKVLELLFSDLQMAQNLEKALQGLADEGFVVQSINTTFSSVLVVANKYGNRVPMPTPEPYYCSEQCKIDNIKCERET